MLQGKNLRKSVRSYLVLFSGLQMFSLIYYLYDVLKDNDTWKNSMKPEYFNGFKFGLYTLFITSVLYHAFSKALSQGTSGLPIQYFFIFINIAQLISIFYFFFGLCDQHSSDWYTIFNFFITLPTCFLGIWLNFLAWKPLQIQIHDENIFFLNRRRDWGIAGTLFTSFQAFMTIWNCCFSAYYGEAMSKALGKWYKLHITSWIFMLIGSMGYHCLGMKISKGFCPCHKSLNLVCLIFTSINLIGLIFYIITCIKGNMFGITYFHIVIFGIGSVISGYANSFLSKLTLKDENNYAQIDCNGNQI